MRHCRNQIQWIQVRKPRPTLIELMHASLTSLTRCISPVFIHFDFFRVPSNNFVRAYPFRYCTRSFVPISQAFFRTTLSLFIGATFSAFIRLTLDDFKRTVCKVFTLRIQTNLLHLKFNCQLPKYIMSKKLSGYNFFYRRLRKDRPGELVLLTL